MDHWKLAQRLSCSQRRHFLKVLSNQKTSSCFHGNITVRSASCVQFRKNPGKVKEQFGQRSGREPPELDGSTTPGWVTHTPWVLHPGCGFPSAEVLFCFRPSGLASHLSCRTAAHDASTEPRFCNLNLPIIASQRSEHFKKYPGTQSNTELSFFLGSWVEFQFAPVHSTPPGLSHPHPTLDPPWDPSWLQTQHDNKPPYLHTSDWFPICICQSPVRPDTETPHITTAQFRRGVAPQAEELEFCVRTRADPCPTGRGAGDLRENQSRAL